MKSLKKKKENKVLGSTTTTYGGTVIYDSADKSIIVTPNESVPTDFVKTETRICRRETYSDGTITSVPVGSHKTDSLTICETEHGRLVKTKDGFLRVYLGVKYAEKKVFAGIIRRESEQMAAALEK